MTKLLGEPAPDFSAETTKGYINFHDWLDGDWCILFSHPKDFTPVCTTELGAIAQARDEFDRLGVKIIGLSVDSIDQHERWLNDILQVQGTRPTYPIIADTELKVAKLYGMLPWYERDTSRDRTAADNATVRTVFVIGPDKTIRLTMSYPMSTGRNIREILRVIRSMQMTENCQVATPADWQPGDDVIILPALSDATARELFPNGWTAPKPYLRLVRPPD